MLIKRKGVFYWPVFFMLVSLAFFASFPCGAALAQGEYNIQTHTDKQSITEGERFTLTVIIRSNSSITTEPKQPDLKDFVIDGRQQFSRISIVNGAQSVEAGYHYSLRPLKPGKLTIGRFEINYTDPAGVPKTAQSEPITIEVSPEAIEEETAPPSVESAHPKEEQIEREIISKHLLVITAIILLAFALIWFVIWQSAKKERKTAYTSAGNGDKLQINLHKNDETRHTDAPAGKNDATSSGLTAAETRAIIDPAATLKNIISLKSAGDYRQMFVQIPKYIKQCASFQTKDNGGLCELTNQEFIGRVNKIPGIASRESAISNILSLCDMVNYAKYAPAESEIDSTINELNNISRLFERGGN